MNGGYTLDKHDGSSVKHINSDDLHDIEHLILSKTNNEASDSDGKLQRTTSNSFANDIAEDVQSIQEMEILSQIQELQRQLWQLQAREDSDEDTPKESKNAAKHRLVMVSNRLPVSLKRDEETGELEIKMSSGGLVTALSGMRGDTPFVWVGWLGCEIPEDEQESVRKRLREGYNLEPVFLPEEDAELYYNGFCNDVLWPLFHYEPLPSFKRGDERKFEVEMWNAYKSANKLFAEAVLAMYEPGDLVWVHDYHLMALPAMLRKRLPNSRIGWFLHIPFPSSEVYRMLPVRKQVLEGVLCSDLVGFHTYDYARHFLSTCTRVLGLECSPRGVDFHGHFTSIGVFPIGIDPQHFLNITQRERTKNRIKDLVQGYEGVKVLIGVDRLDYIKGMPHKLLAMELLLKRYPEWVKNVVLVQIAVPSRTKVEDYKKLSSQVNELVGRINGRYGTLDYTPIHYINQSVHPEELCALYNLSDVAIITSIRDGMNLVSHEYVVCQSIECPKRDGPGVLVLSEFAGSAQSLSGAIRVNPWNTEELCNAIHQALTLSAVERDLRHTKLYRYVTSHTAAFWANSFLEELKETIGKSVNANDLPKLPIRQVLEAYQSAKSRLIVCDYDGTLVQLEAVPQLATPPLQLRASINLLSRDPRNTIMLISGRQRSTLTSLLGGTLKCGLAAEHGFVYRLHRAGKWYSICEPNVDESWKNAALPIMAYFTERTPGSFVERKKLSLAWHYRDADPDFGAWQAKDLQVHLEDVVSDFPIDVLQNGRMVEVKHKLANKGKMLERILQHCTVQGFKPDFVFCAGDDRSDEDMFQMLDYIAEISNQRNPVSTETGENTAKPDGFYGSTTPPQPMMHVSNLSAEAISSIDQGMDRGIADTQDLESYVGPLGEAAIKPDANVFSCHVGRDRSLAKYFVEDFKILRQLMHSFADISRRQVGISFPKKSTRTLRKSNDKIDPIETGTDKSNPLTHVQPSDRTKTTKSIVTEKPKPASSILNNRKT